VPLPDPHQQQQQPQTSSNELRLVALAGALRECTTYPGACNEIAVWCADPRAYTPATELALVECLRVRPERTPAADSPDTKTWSCTQRDREGGLLCVYEYVCEREWGCGTS
jgi:hypothetical protein